MNPIKRSPLLLLILEALMAQTPALQAQREAASDVVGYVQAEARPGVWADLSPVFAPATTAGGLVAEVKSTPKEKWMRGTWSQSLSNLPDPPTSFLWPITGSLAGRPLTLGQPLTTSPDATFWNSLSPYLLADGQPLGTTALATGQRLTLNPYYLIDEIAGPASQWEEGTLFQFGGIQASVVRGAAEALQWESGGVFGPGLVTQDILGPYWLKRPETATLKAPFVLTGTYALGSPSRVFVLRPNTTTSVFRPDGLASNPLLVKNEANLLLGPLTTSKSAVLGTSTFTNLQAADKVMLYQRESGAEQTYFFKTGTLATGLGWYRLFPDQSYARVADEELPSILLPAGAAVRIARSATTTTVSTLKLPFPTNSVSTTGPLIPVPVTSKDGDLLPDAWELLHFPSLLPSAVLTTADPDLDGFTNVQEYLLGGNPAAFDHPALLEVRPLSAEGVISKVTLSFLSAAGMKYRLDSRLAEEATWSPILPLIIGSGSRVEFIHTLPTASLTSLSARLYRVVGLGPVDTDTDGLGDVEEWVLGTDPQKSDTDADGVSDGVEAKTAGRNPLDYWDASSFAFVITGDRQVAAPDTWVREPIKVKVTRKLLGGSVNVPLPKDLKVSFVLTRGSARFGKALETTETSASLTESVDANGERQVFVKLGSWDSCRFEDSLTGTLGRPVQGMISVRVDSDSQNRVLFNETFTLYPSQHLTLPSDIGLVTWLRADRGVQVNASNEVTRWQGGGNFGAGPMPNLPTPKVFVDPAGRSWLRFTGKEALLLDDLPGRSYSLIASARGGAGRSAAAVPTASTGMTAGVLGQYYLFSGALPPDLPGLPIPYGASSYRSYGVSLGTASVGLLELGFDPFSHSPALLPSAAVSGTGATGVLLSLLAAENAAPIFRFGGKTAPGVTGALRSEPHYLPRFIGGRTGGANGTGGTGLFVGDLRDLLIFNRALSEPEAGWMEDVMMAEQARFAAGYVAFAPAIHRDSAKDSLPDWWERAFFGNHLPLGTDDPDKDKVNNANELIRGTHPRMADTDGDGWDDGLEGIKGTSPVAWDTDNDLLADAVDPLPLDPKNGRTNSDGIGFAQGWDSLISQYNFGTDSDGDGLSDLFEVAWLGTDPNQATALDTDADGIADVWELSVLGDLTTATATSHWQNSEGQGDGDGLSDLDEFRLGLNPQINDLGAVGSTLLNEAVTMDDQGRLRSLGEQTWDYDAEGSITTKN